MPAVQLKNNVDAKSTCDEDKSKGHTKAKIRERNISRRPETPLDRHVKRKKNIVPELDLKSLSPTGQSKRRTGKDTTPRKLRTASSARQTVTKQNEKKRQLDTNSVFSKFASIQRYQASKMAEYESFMSEMKSSRSYFYLSPRDAPNNSLADVENINPNQPPDNFFECNEMDDYYRFQFPDFENSSEYEFQTPKLFDEMDIPALDTVRSSDCENSPGVLRHFKELLEQEENSKSNILAQNEIALLKDIIKADERHQKLKRDDYELLKEILLGQLKEISQQERVIQIALKKIRGRNENGVEVTTIKVDTAEQPMEDALKSAKSTKSNRTDTARSKSIEKNSSRSKNKTPRQEVDIIFKNVPSLEKEIRILRSLGLKLEETLSKSVEAKTPEKPPPTHTFHDIQRHYFKHGISVNSFVVPVKAILRCSDHAQEYQIRHQTIDELKLEREFYIPTDIDNFTLQRTDFHKLSHNPEMLLRRLRPFTKGNKMKFNFIEQDPIFFNHFLQSMCKICADSDDGYRHTTFIPPKIEYPNQDVDPLPEKKMDRKIIARKKNGSGDHSDTLYNEKIYSRLKLSAIKDKPTSSTNGFNRRKQRKRTSVKTPIYYDRIVSPKNNLLKTIFLGTLQLSIILTVVTAIWYPDLICL